MNYHAWNCYELSFMQSFCNDPGRIWTCDPWIKSPLLYQLSYRVDVILTCSCTDTQLPFWTLSKLLWRKSFRLIDNQALGTFRTLSNRLLQNTNFLSELCQIECLQNLGDFDIVDTSNSSCPSQVTYDGKSIWRSIASVSREHYFSILGYNLGNPCG